MRSGDLAEPLQLAAGDRVVFTIVEGADGRDGRISGGRASGRACGRAGGQVGRRVGGRPAGPAGVGWTQPPSQSILPACLSCLHYLAVPCSELGRVSGGLDTCCLHLKPADHALPCPAVNYDEFVEDCSVGDTLLVDGGIMSMAVERITDTGAALAGCTLLCAALRCAALLCLAGRHVIQGFAACHPCWLEASLAAPPRLPAADVECSVVDGGTMASRRAPAAIALGSCHCPAPLASRCKAGAASGCLSHCQPWNMRCLKLLA